MTVKRAEIMSDQRMPTMLLPKQPSTELLTNILQHWDTILRKAKLPPIAILRDDCVWNESLLWMHPGFEVKENVLGIFLNRLWLERLQETLMRGTVDILLAHATEGLATPMFWLPLTVFPRSTP